MAAAGAVSQLQIDAGWTVRSAGPGAGESGRCRLSGEWWRAHVDAASSIAPVTTLKIALLVGILGSAFAVALSYAVAGMQGTSPTRDEIARQAIIAFLIGTFAILAVSRRPKA